MEKTRSNRLIYIAIAALAVVGVLVAFMLSQSSNQNDPVAAGQNIVVTVEADALENMYGYEFRLLYNADDMEFTGTLISHVDEIQTIFSKPFDGYELVGATMIGEQTGVSGKNMELCDLVFTAKKDGVLGDFTFQLNSVNVVKDDLEYLENLEGWQYSTAVQPEAEG